MTSITDKNEKSYDEGAKEWAEQIQTNAGHKYLEKPAIEKELPDDLTDKSVLSIGVGSGYELDELLKRNPAKIVGIDMSGGLLKIAAEGYPNVEFIKMDMMKMSFPDNSFDLVYSSLTFHYANDWDVLLSGIHRVLRKGGLFVFSTHNPEYLSLKPKTGNTYTNERGVPLIEHTATLPAGNINITFYNHPDKQSIIDSLKHARFRIESFFSPSVVEITKNQYESLEKAERDEYDKIKEKNLKIPLFLVVRAIAT